MTDLTKGQTPAPDRGALGFGYGECEDCLPDGSCTMNCTSSQPRALVPAGLSGEGLLPCPFCDREDLRALEVDHIAQSDGREFVFACVRCRACGGRGRRVEDERAVAVAKAVSNWNRRPALTDRSGAVDREAVAKAFEAGIRYAAEEMDALDDDGSAHGNVKERAADTYGAARDWLLGLDPAEVESAKQRFLASLIKARSQPEGGAVPVAWLYRHEEFGRALDFQAPTRGDLASGYTGTPLYAAPPASRAAPEALALQQQDISALPPAAPSSVTIEGQEQPWADLERMAKAATPGPWVWEDRDLLNPNIRENHKRVIHDIDYEGQFLDPSDADAAFIAAANPAAVLELIAAARANSVGIAVGDETNTNSREGGEA